MNPQLCVDTPVERRVHSQSLSWAILETADLLFRNKGYDNTTIMDICIRIDINKSQFYSHFDSLDDVLEILWAR